MLQVNEVVRSYRDSLGCLMKHRKTRPPGIAEYFDGAGSLPTGYPPCYSIMRIQMILAAHTAPTSTHGLRIPRHGMAYVQTLHTDKSLGRLTTRNGLADVCGTQLREFLDLPLPYASFSSLRDGDNDLSSAMNGHAICLNRFSIHML